MIKAGLSFWPFENDFAQPPIIMQRGRKRTEAHTQITANLPGGYRVANDALALYELYRGTGTSPDFTAAPWETFASLPHETAALAANADYYFALRWRNKYGMVTKNIEETLISIDAGGDQNAVIPSDPIQITIDPAASGAVRIRAYYNYLQDSSPATQFLVYLTSNGVNPIPGTDTPAVETMIKSDGLAKLDYTSGTFADGLDMRTIVQVRRVDSGPANVDSTDATVYSTTSDTDGPAAVTGAAYFGEIAEEKQ